MLICFLNNGDERIYRRIKSKRYNWFNYQYTGKYYNPDKYMIIDNFVIDDFGYHGHKYKVYVLMKKEGVNEKN